MSTTEAECLDALREAAATLGESPSKPQYEELGLTPASATIIRVVGGWNDAKEAAELETNPSTGRRVAPPPDDVPADIEERWADLSVDQRWHYRHPDENANRTRVRRSELRSWVRDRKSERGCRECGCSDPVCLDFHHRDSDTKVEKVSKLVTNEASKSVLREEFRKCEVLCANCHRAEHPPEFDFRFSVELRTDPSRLVPESQATADRGVSKRTKQRKWVHEYKRDQGCCRCGYGVPAALDLHHERGEKSSSVSQLVTDGCTLEQLLAEVEKCDVICANCHRREHLEGSVGEGVTPGADPATGGD